ncbi:hypothetical protein FXW78_51255 [Rhodococcus opacus]|nr:hypothetical protein [Rhodococcus opacus]
MRLAQVRVAAETLKAEQRLAALRLAAEAETAIEREQQRRRVVAARGGELTAPSHALDASDHVTEPTPPAELPTAAALTAPSASDDPPAATETGGADTENLPVPVGTAPVQQRRSGPLRVLPAGLPLSNPLPDITQAVTGLVRPFVPPILARAVGHTQRILVEEVEEVSVRYTRRTVTVDEEQTTSASVGEPTERTPNPRPAPGDRHPGGRAARARAPRIGVRVADGPAGCGSGRRPLAHPRRIGPPRRRDRADGPAGAAAGHVTRPRKFERHRVVGVRLPSAAARVSVCTLDPPTLVRLGSPLSFGSHRAARVRRAAERRLYRSGTAPRGTAGDLGPPFG